MKNFRDMNRAITDGEVSNFVEGLYVQNGRLINSRPDGIMGIEKAAKLKKMVKQQNNVEQIAEGIRRANMLEKFMD